MTARASIPLASAYLCCDCEHIGDCPTQCPACASTALLSLKQVLNRVDPQPEARRA